MMVTIVIYVMPASICCRNLTRIQIQVCQSSKWRIPFGFLSPPSTPLQKFAQNPKDPPGAQIFAKILGAVNSSWATIILYFILLHFY
jgi:hypothetical protein